MAEHLPVHEENELEVLSETEELLEEDFEESEESKLTTKQILLLILLGFFSFFLFVFLLFPVEEIIRSYSIKYAAEAGINLDFKSLNFPLLFRKQIDGLYILTKGNTEIQAEEVDFDISLLALTKNQILADLETTSFQLDTGDVILKIKKFNLNTNISNYEKGINFTGAVELQTGSGQILKLPNFPFLGDLSGTGIKSVSLELKKVAQTINIEKGIFNLSIAKITVKGKMEMGTSFMNSSLNLEICPKLTPEFSAEREDLANTLAAISKDGEACIPIRGTVSQPQADLSKLMGGSQNNSNSGAP